MLFRALLGGAIVAATSSVSFAQLVYGRTGSGVLYTNDVSTNTNTSHATSVPNPGGLAADVAGSKLYVSSSSVLYTLPFVAGPTTSVQMTFNSSNMIVDGLAFNSTNGKLYGSRTSAGSISEGFFEINPVTGVGTQILATLANDYSFDGFDYDPSTNLFYGLNDEVGPGPKPAGLYAIDLLAVTPTITKIADYPAGETDLDGLAIGNGKAYFVEDEGTEIYVFNLGTSQYETSLTSAFTGLGQTRSGATWAPGFVPEPASLSVVALAGSALLRRRRA